MDAALHVAVGDVDGEHLGTDTSCAATADRIEVRLLGALRVRRRDGSVVHEREWRTSKTADLVRRLALELGEPVGTEALIEGLWPTSDPARGRASLRTAVSHVRRVLGADAVERRLGGLVLRGAWVDAVAFTALAAEVRRCLRDGRLTRAVGAAREACALYVEDLRAADDDAQWVIMGRASLAAAHRCLLADAADAAVALGWMADAVDFATLAVDADPASERAYRALMRGYAGIGETERALREYERCRAELAERVGADLSPQTRAVHLQILGAEPTTPTSVPFVGRDAESAWLLGVLRRGRAAGRTPVVRLSGAAGSGRHRLVQELCRAAGLRAVEVSVPGNLGAGLAEQVRNSDGADPRARLVVVADDARLDAQEVGRLLSLPRAVPGCAAVVLLATDDVAPEETPLEDWRAAGMRTLALGPLAVDDVTRVATDVLAGRPAPALVDRLMQVALGVPGRLVATLSEWSRTGRVVATSAGLALAPEHVDDPSDPDAQRLLARALGQLGEDSLGVMLLAATLDRPVTPGLLAPLLDGPRPGERALQALGELVDLSLMRVDGAAYVWSHPRLSDGARAWSRPAVRARLHRCVAERAVLPAGERVVHWLAAGERAPACLAALEAADAAAADGDHAAARTHLLQVCTLGDVPEAAPSDRAALFERLGDSCAVLRRPLEASTAYAVAVKVAAAHDLPDLCRLRSKLETVSAEDWLERGAPLLVPARRDPAPVTALFDVLGRAGVDAAAGPGPATEVALRTQLADARRRGDAAEVAEVLLALAVAVGLPARRVHEARTWARAAREGRPGASVLVRAATVEHLADGLLGNGRQVVDALEDAQLHADEVGDESEAADRLLALRILVSHDLDRPEFPVLWQPMWQRLSEPKAADGDGVPAYLVWTAVRILVERGDLDDADRVAALPRTPGPVLPVLEQLGRLASAALEKAKGQEGCAATSLRAALRHAEATGTTLLVPEAAARLAALVAREDLPQAIALLDRAERGTGEAGGMPRESVLRLLARAEVRAARGLPAAAAEAARDAAVVAGQAGLVHLAAEARAVQARHEGAPPAVGSGAAKRRTLMAAQLPGQRGR